MILYKEEEFEKSKADIVEKLKEVLTISVDMESNSLVGPGHVPEMERIAEGCANDAIIFFAEMISDINRASRKDFVYFFELMQYIIVKYQRDTK